jgi:hypothetical protein
VNSLSVSSPSAELDGYFWYADDPNHPNYYRIGSLNDDVEGPLYDAYIDVKSSYGKMGELHVKASVVIYDARGQHEVWESEIFNKVFDGNNQPSEQAFLNNFHHHKNRLKETFEMTVRSAEMYIEEDIEIGKIPPSD